MPTAAELWTERPSLLGAILDALDVGDQLARAGDEEGASHVYRRTAEEIVSRCDAPAVTSALAPLLERFGRNELPGQELTAELLGAFASLQKTRADGKNPTLLGLPAASAILMEVERPELSVRRRVSERASVGERPRPVPS